MGTYNINTQESNFEATTKNVLCGVIGNIIYDFGQIAQE